MSFRRLDNEGFLVRLPDGIKMFRNSARVTIYTDAEEHSLSYVAQNALGIGHAFPANYLTNSVKVYVNGVEIDSWTYGGQVLVPSGGLTIGDIVTVVCVTATSSFYIDAGTEEHAINTGEYIDNSTGRLHIEY